MSEPERELLRWAEAVVDGQPVDWQEASRSGEAPEPRLRRLQILAALAGACGMPAAAPAPKTGVLFRWCDLEVREPIGEGVYGQVFRAWDTKLEREVAVKFLRADGTAAAAHALQEARRLARVRHPGVVMVFGAEERDGRVGIWMEHIHGAALEDLLTEQGPFTSHEATLIGIDLCRALDAVHRADLVHRDVKTRNVVREDTGRIVLMDFGAGATTGEAQGMVGTPIYLAPEVLRGQAASPASDLYCLGVLLYRLATGEYPFAGTNVEALRAAHERGEMRSMRGLHPDIPAAFRSVVERALAADPARRFASAAQMERALQAVLEGPRRAARRRGRVVALSGLTVAALGLWFFWPQLRPMPTAPSQGRPTIAVADVVGSVHDPDLGALSGMLVTSLEESRGLPVMTRSQLTDLLERIGRPADAIIDRALGLELGRRAGATALLLLTPRQEAGGGYRVTLEAVDPRHGRRLFTTTAVADGKGQLSAAIDTLSQRTRLVLLRGAGASRAAIRPVAQITTTNLAAYRHYDHAERLIDRLEMPEARAELDAAVSIDSTFGLAYARLAYVYWWLGEEKGERAAMSKAFALIDRVPERHRFHLRAEAAMADREGLEAARSILLEMERFYPQDKEMLYDIGDLSSHLNEFPTAIHYLDRVVAQDPHFGRALQHLTRVYRDMGRPGPFLRWARRYAAADSVWDTYVLLGNAQLAAGDTSAGIATLRRGRALNPGHEPEFDFRLANAYFWQGRVADGLGELDHTLTPTASASVRAGDLRNRSGGHIQQGAYREAVADLERAAELARRDRDRVNEAAARMEMAGLLMVGCNDGIAALRQVGRCAKLEDAITYRDAYYNYWPYWGGLFKLRLLNGDIAAAEALARQRFAVDKWYGPYVESYLHAARGECAQATAAASRIVEWGPAAENIPLLYFLARCQLEGGHPNDAVAFLLRLQTMYSNLTVGTPYYAKSLLLLGKAHERMGDATAAARSYARLLDLWKEGDPELPDRLEARQRLHRLEAVLVSRR